MNRAQVQHISLHPSRSKFPSKTQPSLRDRDVHFDASEPSQYFLPVPFGKGQHCDRTTRLAPICFFWKRFDCCLIAPLKRDNSRQKFSLSLSIRAQAGKGTF